jgi:hypothetical protein
MDDIHTIPDDLPVPEDDGAADHLLGAAVPRIALKATTGESIRPDEPNDRSVLFCYGRIGHVFYPVFPPDSHAAAVLEWLRG